jgi:hypothetical protein
MATGPVWRYGDEATNAAAIGGSTAAYSPWYAGSPANSAYASACGISTNATLTPATRSPAGSFPGNVVCDRVSYPPRAFGR